MAAALSILPLAIEIAFVLLAVAILVDWIRFRDRHHGYLALGISSLTALLLIAPSLGQTSDVMATDAALALFLISGCGLLLFRHSFIPLGRHTARVVILLIAVVFALGLVAGLPADPQAPRSPFQVVALAAILTTWALCVAEPIVTFWAASRGRPAVEGARMRAFSLGYTCLIAVVLVGTLGGEAVRNPNAELVLDIVALAVVPILYMSFYPPTWLRRLWSQPEEEELRAHLHDLLTYSPDKATQAKRAIGWATRLVGAKGAFIVDSDRSLLAVRGMSDAEAGALMTSALAADADTRRKAGQKRSTLVVPLELHDGRGAMVIVPGPFAPHFGDDEAKRLRQYGSSITAGLDRVSLYERVRALEQAKTDFLNIASHELRGPMTVIKGYITMLESGSLGNLPPRAASVLPLLIAKSDEVTWMLEQMIEAARLEEGRFALKKENGDIVELTEQAIADVMPLIVMHEVTFDKPSDPIPADVDPDRFRIVVKNLISNAAKYSVEGRPITVNVTREGTFGTVEVIDQGIGISEEDQRRLFTRFDRIESPSTPHVSGTGLGLWLSREIARMHDGDLTVESEPGKGSTFTFQVPVTA